MFSKQRMKWFHYILIYISIIFALSINIIIDNLKLLDSINLVIRIFFSGAYNSDISFDRDFSILNLLAISGLLIQLFVLMIFLTLLMRYIMTKENKIKYYISYFTFNLPYRQILIGWFLSSNIIAIIIFKFVEKTSWLDAFYFVVITITTVGYGDLVATTAFTKLLTILLIINGISFLGLASQLLVDRIVQIQLDSQLNIPSEKLKYENHVIVAGYGAKGRKLASLLIDRQYKVIVVEKDATRSSIRINEQVEVINADITKPNILKLLALDKSAGLFLLLSNDNQTIQTGMVARSIAPDLDIYAELTTIPTYNIARHAGINRPISLFHYLINVLRSNLFHKEILPLESIDNMKLYESKLGYVQVPINFNYTDIFNDAIELGYVNPNINEFSPCYYPALMENIDSIEDKKKEARLNKTHMLLAVDKEELLDKSKSFTSEVEKVKHNRVIFAGYHQFVDEFIKRLGIGSQNTIILWQNQREKELLESREYQNYQWTLESGIGLLERLVKENDLVICSFDDITSSMIVAVTLNKMDQTTHLIQLVPYEYDIEPLIQIGAESVITPQRIISDALLTSFIKANYLTPSLIYTDGHIYEYLVDETDIYQGKTVGEVCKSGHLSILFIQKETENAFREALLNDRIHNNDRIIVYIRSNQ